MRKVSLEMYYFVFINDGALTFKISKKMLNPFCDETPQIYKHVWRIEYFKPVEDDLLLQ